MKISETDNRFWKLVGDICFSDFDVNGFEYDSSKDLFTLIALGERIKISREHLNTMLEDKNTLNYIKDKWKTGNTFDGKIDKEV